MDSGHWDITDVGEFDPEEWFGFLYLIEEKATGKGYIGKKFFRFKRKKTKSDPSKTKGSGWQTYTSSCDILKDLIAEQGKDAFAFRILRLCTGRCELSYSEEEVQFTHDVLRARLPNGERKYFNKTIAYRNFAGIEKQTEESRRKISETMKQKGIVPPKRDAEVIAEELRVRWENPLFRQACIGWLRSQPVSRMKAVSAALSPEERSRQQKERMALLTPEERSARAQKARAAQLDTRVGI